jgi:hypothetical protein
MAGSGTDVDHWHALPVQGTQALDSIPLARHRILVSSLLALVFICNLTYAR